MQVKRRIAVITVAAMMGLGVAACGSSTTSAPAPAKAPATAPAPAPTTPPTTAAPAPAPTTPPATAAPAPAPAVADAPNNQAFLSLVNSFGGTFNNVPDSQLLALGNAVCTDLESGNSVDSEASAMIADPGPFNQTELGEIMGAAGSDLCQSQLAAIQAWANSNSGTSA